MVVQDLLPGDGNNILASDLGDLASIDILSRELKASKVIIRILKLSVSFYLAPKILSRTDPRRPPIPATRMTRAWLGARLRSAEEEATMTPQ